MGKLGRFACIFVPMGMTIGSLICLILVWLGNTKTSGSPSSLYWFKADTSDFTSNPNIIKGNYDQLLLSSLDATMQHGNLKDFYTVGLWNYCSGKKASDGSLTVEYCSDRKADYYFDPAEVWDLNNDAADDILGSKLKDALNVYKKLTKWIFTAYAIAFFATAAEIVVGFFAIFSRWGSFATTIVSAVSSFFTFGATISATVVYAAMVGAMEAVFHPFGIKTNLGGSMLATTWIATALSLGAGFFWMVSVCCCSGRSNSPAHASHHGGEKGYKGAMAEKTAYSYEPVSGPSHANRSSAHSAAPLVADNQYAGPYEPYRHS